MKFNPQQKALAFRIWAFCKPLEWNVTIPEIAEHFKVTHQKVTNVLKAEKWLDRVSKVATHTNQVDRITGGLNWLDRPSRNRFETMTKAQFHDE